MDDRRRLNVPRSEWEVWVWTADRGSPGRDTLALAVVWAFAVLCATIGALGGSLFLILFGLGICGLAVPWTAAKLRDRR